MILRPVLDSFRVMSVAAAGFLSGCTVLSMSLYSVAMTRLSGDNRLKANIALPLGVGAALGGVLGGELFKRLSATSENPDAVGVVQSACLMLITLLTLVCTLFSARIRARDVKNPAAVAGIGLLLGVVSAFLGIGGGPINLIALGGVVGRALNRRMREGHVRALFCLTPAVIVALSARNMLAYLR